jgi:DNA-binding FadR family transcriptional regulator
MKGPKSRTTIEGAAGKLRGIALATKAGTLLGSEEDLIARLQVSRATVRQVARLLEREGLLRVRRGINGGYFAARPDVHTIEATVSAYLETFDTDLEDIFAVASALWVEVMRKAAARNTREARSLARHFKEQVAALPQAAEHEQVLALELESQTAIFGLIKSHYIHLIFQINVAFATRRLDHGLGTDHSPAHRDFVQAWRSAKLMELEAIADGDPEMAAIAARHMRNLWRRRTLERMAG